MIHPFDQIARDYDATFTHTQLGIWLRQRVWAQLAALFPPASQVLELGCGTGEDAIWLARRGVAVWGVDVAPAMLAIARAKAQTAGVAGRVTLTQGDLAALGHIADDDPWHAFFGTPIPPATFDGAFSNFGVLNCLADRQPLAQALARVIRPGGTLILVLMGPWCPWEMLWYGIHGQWRLALRRFRSGMPAQVGEDAVVQVWYPSPRRLRAEFAPYFAVRRTMGIGALLPPSYLAHVVDRWPAFFGLLAWLECRLGSTFPWTWLADHYLMVFERRPRLKEEVRNYGG